MLVSGEITGGLRVRCPRTWTAILRRARERAWSATPASAPSAAAFYTACAGCCYGCTVCRRTRTERQTSRERLADDYTSPRTAEPLLLLPESSVPVVGSN